MKINKLNCLFIDINFFKRPVTRNQIFHKNRSKVLQKNIPNTVLFQKNPEISHRKKK